jgi:hypothetical protein
MVITPTASEDMPVVEGVAEMRRMEVMHLEPFEVGCCWGVAVVVAGRDNRCCAYSFVRLLVSKSNDNRIVH